MPGPSMDVPLPETYEEGDDVVEDDGPLSESEMLKQKIERLMRLETYAKRGFHAAGMEFDKQKKVLEQEAMRTRNTRPRGPSYGPEYGPNAALKYKRTPSDGHRLRPPWHRRAPLRRARC